MFMSFSFSLSYSAAFQLTESSIALGINSKLNHTDASPSHLVIHAQKSTKDFKSTVSLGF